MIVISVTGVENAKDAVKDTIVDVKNELLTTLLAEIKPRTPIDTGRARRGWRRRADTVENKVPYISRLEKGYSKQAPKGFTKQAITATLSKRKAK